MTGEVGQKALALAKRRYSTVIVPRNEGSGGSNEILVGVGSKVRV